LSSLFILCVHTPAFLAHLNKSELELKQGLRQVFSGKPEGEVKQ